jgi:release factor glutamine methyltransferase
VTPAPADAVTWRNLFDEAAARLPDERGRRRVNEVRWMVEEVAGAGWPGIATDAVSERSAAHFLSLVERRAAGEPLQYVLGRWGFRSLDLMVDHRVLIPRPETEQVVEVALTELDRLIQSPSVDERAVVVDLGTGSGAIALAVASERTHTTVWATDRDSQALEVAQANLSGLGGFAATRVRLAQGDWWAALPDELHHRVDLVVSNPPYISAAEMDSLDPEVVAWEPRHALEAGPTGLEDVDQILQPARSDWLSPMGVVVIEIAPHQAAAAAGLARDHGFSEIDIRADLAGRDRVLVARP